MLLSCFRPLSRLSRTSRSQNPALSTVILFASLSSVCLRSSRFSEQVAIVTGGARGIGFAVAERMGREGASVALFDMSADDLAKAKAKLEGSGVRVHTEVVNVTDPAGVASAVAAVVAAFGRLDVLVQAAGVTGVTGINTQDVDPDNFDFVFAVNVKGIFLLCKAALPHMLKRNYGRIVNIASVAGKEGNAGMLAYSSSKAAVIGLTKVIGKEVAETNVKCNCIAPAVIRTEMVAQIPPEQVKYMTDKIPMKRTGELDEAAALACFVASGECSFTTGFCFDLTGGRSTY